MGGNRSGSLRWVTGCLAAGQDVELVLRGFSMAPALRDGDGLRVAPIGRAALRPGEIVVARRGPRLVTHRLRAVDGGLAVTRGDGCTRDDPPVPLSAIVGRVVEVRRGGRRLPPPTVRSWRRLLALARRVACR